MAQSKSNEVKNPARSFGSIPGRYNSRNIFSITPGPNANQLGAGLTLPGRGGSAGMALPALGGVQGNPVVPYNRPGNGTTTGTSALPQTAPKVSTASPQYDSSGAGIAGQLDSIKTKALDIQSELNRRNQVGANSGTSGRTLTPRSEPTSFRGILDSLLGASNPTREQERTRREMERIAKGNKTIADNAARISEQYGQEIARVGDLGAGAVAGNLSTGSNVVGAGNANLAANAATARMQALGTAQKAALEGTGQQLTAQQQTAEAFQPSLGAALTQQQQQLSGLGTAAGLAAPMQIPYSAGGFDPLTGQQIAGGFGGWAGYTTAQQAQDLIAQYPDAGVQYNPNLTPEQNLQAVQTAVGGSPTYQRNTFGVPGQTSVAGAQATQTAKTGYDQSYQTYNQIQAQKSYADNIANQLSTTMQQYGINPSDARKINEINNYLGRQFGEEGQSAFQTALAEAQRAYSALLTIGGGTIPTEATAAANTILNPNATLGQVTAAIEQLKAAGTQRLISQGELTNTYWNQLQQASTTQTGGGGTGGGDWNW